MIRMSMEKIDITALGQAIDSTFGRSSTPKTASYSVKVTFAGADMLKVSYAAIVNFGTEREMIQMKRMYEGEAKSVIEKVLKHIKETYKDITDTSIKFTPAAPTNSIEILSMNPHNPKRSAYFRSQLFVEIG